MEVVYIANVLSEIQTCIADQDTTSDTLLKILNTILILISSTIIILYLRRLFIRQSTKPCVHCLEEGRNTVSTGFCGKCGAAHCDPSFSLGCTVCKSTTFVRN